MTESEVFLVFVDGKPGHERAYAEWFCGQHMADMRRLPGVSFAYAGHLSALDEGPSPAQLCGYYETPDCRELLATIAASKGTDALPVSDLQGKMVWRVLETATVSGGIREPSEGANLLICMFTGEPELSDLPDMSVEAARLTRMGAIQPARGREFGSVLFASLPDEADPAAVAAMIAERCGTEGARFLLASASKPR